MQKNNLPETPEKFFLTYHDFCFEDRKFSTEDFENAIEVLREAYKKYPDYREKISSIARIVKIGLNSFGGVDKVNKK